MKFDEGSIVWIGYSFLLPNDFPVVDLRLVLSQWKSSCGVFVAHCNPTLALRYRGGKFFFDTKIERFGLVSRKNLFQSNGDFPKEKWIKITYNLKLTRRSDGFVRVWLDDKQIINHLGPTGHLLAAPLYYFKLGLYRDSYPEPMTIYVDDYWRGGEDTCKIIDSKPVCKN